MCRKILIFVILFISPLFFAAGAPRYVVADSASHLPLPHASIYDRHGKAVGITDARGNMPEVAPERYPLTVRYLGFFDKKIPAVARDTVFLREDFNMLPEVVIETKGQRLLHIVAYVHEYSTLTTYSDTISLFREKMVDYMLPADPKSKFKGWRTTRTLSCKSYYRFTDYTGLDSVSDSHQNHFSWADWIGIAPDTGLPPVLKKSESATDTIRGRYSPAEIWSRNGDSVNVEIDVLADSLSRKWVPNLRGFFNNNLEFEQFRVNFEYSDVIGETITPADLTKYSFNIESQGRGYNMFDFNRQYVPVFVSTSAEVYVLDKEYISLKEAKKWYKRDFNDDCIDIFIPAEAAALQPSVTELIERVNNIDKEGIRLKRQPDRRLVSPYLTNDNFKFGKRVLALLKTITGISAYKSKRNLNRRWNEFTERQKQRNCK